MFVIVVRLDRPKGRIERKEEVDFAERCGAVGIR